MAPYLHMKTRVLLLNAVLACAVLVPADGAAAQPAAAAPTGVAPAPDQTVLIKILRDEASAYEHGDGVERDGVRAAALYCQAAKMGDAESQFNLGWLYTNGRGVERSEATAAFFFNAAAEQGFEQAKRMLGTVGGPTVDVPECMRPPPRPAPQPVRVAAAPAARAAMDRPFAPQVEVTSRGPKYIVDLVKQIAPEYKLEPQLVLSIIETESNFDAVALSPKNARGLMQLIPETAARFGVRNSFDPAQNIRGGMAYLRWLLAYFEGDVALVAAAYNAGEAAVERYRGVPPYLETLTYVRKVLTAARMVDHGFDATVTEPSPQLRAIRDPRRSR
jgi:Transglycosylase SLT domain/Sel1 repeat